jgi:hypothetical protein
MRTKYVEISCDVCGSVDYYPDGRYVEAAAKDNGWLIRYFNRKVHHFCSEKCVAKFREANKT